MNSRHTIAVKRLKARHRAEWRFRWYGRLALVVACLALLLLLASIAIQGWQGFTQTRIQLNVQYDRNVIDPDGTQDPRVWAKADYPKLVHAALREIFPDVTERADRRKLYALMSSAAADELRAQVDGDPSLIGSTRKVWLPASSPVDMFIKGVIKKATPEVQRPLKDKQLYWIGYLKDTRAVKKSFNSGFFTGGDSREPEQAGFLGSMMGSLLTLLVCVALAFPLGVLTALYLEEFAAQNRFVDIIEVNINNLAAVPSIVFGLLGLALYLNVMHLPRSAPLVGGLTLALMILPVIIITTRVSLKAVPPSIRAAALALGASPLQVAMHHVVPLAMPGIMTGTILGMARAIGETAPLLMIGMVAFIADVPGGFTDPATVMPVQIFLWSDSPELGFVEKTAAGIMTLLVVLVAMNAFAIYIRKRYEVRW